MKKRQNGLGKPRQLASCCGEYRNRFSAYLDGALDGVSMQALAGHLRECASCGAEFQTWREVQEALSDMGPAPIPETLEAQLRDALASERERGTHLSPWRQMQDFWRQTLAPAAIRMSAGLAAALVLTGSVGWFIGSALPVQANDDHLVDLHAPRYLYSVVPPLEIANSGEFGAVLVDAKIDAHGHVYDYDLVQGPSDPESTLR